MQKLIRNNWSCGSGEPFAISRILHHAVHPEGLNVHRIRFVEPGSLSLEPGLGHIISVLRGSGRLQASGAGGPLHLEAGVHLYLPPGTATLLDAEPDTEFLKVSAATAAQARGTRFLVRNEAFLAACASGSQLLRWVLTPQYLSRRIFLHHDPTLLSKSGNPVSWFRTTMFDVAGLPENEDGEPVFKMSYNSRTEFNVCYEVEGEARVRMAHHPYEERNQQWGSWLTLDGDSTYHLNETAGCSEEECRIDEITRSRRYCRNKHEVYIADGHVTLFCLFDPAPTGIENHRPGEYSDYEPLSQVLGTRLYETYQREIAKYDDMVDRLSLARATGSLNSLSDTPAWELYQRGREAQTAIESELAKKLAAQGHGRDRVVARWMQRESEAARIGGMYVNDIVMASPKPKSVHEAKLN